MPREDHSKLGGLVRRKLIREIALREPGTKLGDLAKKYDVTAAAITHFSKRNAEEIAAVAANADDEFAGILIANKAFRIAALVEIFEKAGVPMPKVTPAGKVAYAVDPEDGEEKPIMEVDVRAQMQALKQAAEELGQLPNRVTLTGTMDTTTTYRIAGVDEDDLT